MAVTLAEIEREVAPRVGPYRREVAATGGTSSFTVTALVSSVEQEKVENLYILRRGKKTDGTAVPSFTAANRVRLVKTHTLSTGAVEPDNPYTVAVVADEYVEFHHLHPDGELRPAVQAGLRRCYFVDRSQLTLSAAASERDLTALASWISDPSAVLEVEHLTSGSTELPRRVGWWQAFLKATGVFLQANPDPYPNLLLVTSRRPHSSYVNAAVSTTGPVNDDDTLAVSLEYAAAAGHVECWRRLKARVAGPAQSGKAVSQEEAAREFTRQAYRNYQPPARRAQFSQPFRRHTSLDEVVY